MPELTILTVSPSEDLTALRHQSGVVFTTAEACNLGAARQAHLMRPIQAHGVELDEAQLPVPVLAPREQVAVLVQRQHEGTSALDAHDVAKAFHFLRELCLLPVTVPKRPLLAFAPREDLACFCQRYSVVQTARHLLYLLVLQASIDKVHFSYVFVARWLVSSLSVLRLFFLCLFFGLFFVRVP